MVGPPHRPGTGGRGHGRVGAHGRPAPGPPRPEPAPVPRPDRGEQPRAPPDRRPLARPHGPPRRQEGRHHPDGGGWRVHGRGSEQAKQVERAKNTGTGKSGASRSYTYLHSAVDGFSRLAYTEALPDEKAVTAISFTHRARAFFAAHGITDIHRIVTDNGSCYRAHDFATVLRGARHQRITPYTPRHNGKVERYQRILGEEFLYAHVWTSEQQRTDALTIWNVHYNYHRPHTAAGNRPPATRLHTGVTNVMASYN
ncbi:hypothetical protein GCM10027184_69610 [Saccharothrix stipae]